VRILLVLLSLSCVETLNALTTTSVDADCRAAMRHLRECCPNFHDAAISCLYDTRGMSAGRSEIPPNQAACIQRMSCTTVRSAAAGHDDVCGFEMRANLMKDGVCDGNLPQVKKPSETGD